MTVTIAAWPLAIFLVSFALLLAMGAMVPPMMSKGGQAMAYFATLAMCIAALLLVAST